MPNPSPSIRRCIPARVPRPALLAAILLAVILPAVAARALPSDKGRIGRIAFVGNAHTKELAMRRVMGLAEGDSLDADRLDAAWDALEDCGWFRFVDLGTDRDDDGKLVLTVEVEEDITTYYGPLVRYDRRHKYQLGGWLEERNLGGAGQRLRFEASAWRLQMAGAEWHVPWLAGVRGLEGTLSLRGEQSDFVFRPTRYRKWDAGLATRWTFSGPAFVQGGARRGNFAQRDPYTAESPTRGYGPAGTTTNYAAADEDHWRLSLGAGFDTRDNPFYPHRGASVLVESAWWASNGYADYRELTGDARAFLPLPAGKHLLALRAWGRRVNGPVPLDNLLFLGGPDTIRGSGFGSLEGDEGWLLTAEYRLPLVMVPIAPGGESVGMGLHAFVDGGQAWWDGVTPGDPVVTVGAGAHLSLDTWQLRFEAARNEDHKWFFSFGDRFTF